MAKYIFIIGILISLLIRIFLISQSKHVADVYLLYTMGATFLEGRNPYLVLDFNSYPPLAIYLVAVSMKISSNLHTSFVTIFKLWPNLADFISAILIYKFLVRIKTKTFYAVVWSIFFLLNPIAIIISAAHGQIDSITSLFVLLSIFLLTFYSKSIHIYLSALSLGLAIAFKPNPAMLIPLFLLHKRLKFQQGIFFIFLILTPLSLVFIPFINQQPGLVLARMLGYLGVNDLSYAAILRGIWYQINASTAIPLSTEFLNASKYVFITAATCLTLLMAGSKNLAKAIMTIYLAFLTIYFGIGSQYLVWVLPFAVLAKDKMVIFYTLFGSIALLGFYLFFGPDILFGKSLSIEPFQTKYIYLYFIGNLLFWIFNIFWLFKIIRSYIQDQYSSFGMIRKRLIFITATLFIFSLIPMLNLTMEFFRRFSLEG